MKNYTITVNGTAYEVSVEEGTGSAAPVAAQAAAPAAKAPVAAPKAAPKAAPAGAKGGVKITSPMPGKILGIKASVGDTVKKGQALVILEAMKMENEIVATEDGKVTSIDTSVGASVEAGDLLATLN